MVWSSAAGWVILHWVGWLSIIRDFLLQSEPSVLGKLRKGEDGMLWTWCRIPVFPSCPHFCDKGFVL